MSFTLSTTVQTGAAVLRVSFAGSMPLSASPLGGADVRNPNNWYLMGPSDTSVGEVRTVPSDPFSFDLICTDPVVAGSWVISGLNITNAAGEPLTSPNLIFTAVGPQPFFSVPSDQITSETTLRQALNAALDGPGWRAFIAALGYSDEKVAKAGKAAFYQRLLATAGGEYLERLTTAYGIDKPANVRLSDDVLRRLTIDVNNNTTNTAGIEAVLLAYYGLDATVAHAQSAIPEPFVLGDEDDLILHIDGTDVTVVFRDDDFGAISAAQATEVAAVINRQFWLQDLRAFAMASTDSESGLVYLRIYSGLSGVKGRMKFYGGDAMRGLQFPTIVDTQQITGTQWSLTPSSITNPVPVGRVRLTWIGGTDPQLTAVLTGDRVNIYGAPFSATNRGNFRIVGTTPTYIEFEDAPFAEAQASITQTGTQDVFFVRPSVVTLAGQYVAAVVNTDINTAEILLPVTAAAVERDETSGWYLNGEQTLEVDGTYALSGRASGSTTVRLKTTTPHGLSPGRFIFLDEVEIDYEASLGAAQMTLGAPPAAMTQCYSAVKLEDGRILAVFTTSAATTHNTYFFDPETDTWSTATLTPFSGAGAAPALVLMADGKVMGVGLTQYAIFDPETEVWTSLTNHGFGVSIEVPYNAVLLLNDGRIFVVGAKPGNIGTTWTAISSTTTTMGGNGRALSIAYGSHVDRWVMCGGVGSGISEMAASIDNGVTWTNLASAFTTNAITNVAYGNSLFIATDSGINSMYTSPTGVTFTSIAINLQLGAVGPKRFAYGGSRWIALGNSVNGPASYSDDNSASWTAIGDISFGASTPADIDYGNSVWIIVGTGGTASRSVNNGVTWTAIGTLNLPGGIDARAVSYGNGVWVVVGTIGFASRSVDDGVTWTAIGNMQHSVVTITDVVYGSGYWVAVGGNTSGGRASYSIDGGITWIQVSNPGMSGIDSFRALTFANETFIGVGGFIAGVAARAAPGNFKSSIFTPVTGSWSTPLTIDASRAENTIGAAAVLTAAGNVVVAGGGGSTAQTKAAHYNVPSNSWKAIDDMPSAIGYPHGVAVASGPGGQIWFTGGQSASSNIVALDIASMTWTSKALNQSLPTTSNATLVNRNNEIFWVPSSSALSWELRGSQSWQPAQTLASTTGPAVISSAPNPVWAFDLNDGRVLAVSENGASSGTTIAFMRYAEARTRSGGQLAGGPFKITAVPGADILEFETSENSRYTLITGGEVTPILAENGTIASGFMLNTRDGFAITDGKTTLTAAVAKGFTPTIIDVGSAEDFPDEPGYILLSFGTAHESHAVRYLGTVGTTQLRLDPNEKFDFNYAIGDSVNLLEGRGVFAPDVSVPLGVTWLTDSSVGRIEAELDLDFVVGVGLNVINRVLYPGDRGLGNEGLPKQGVSKISDAVSIWGGVNYLLEAIAAREDE